MRLAIITDLHSTKDPRPGHWIGAFDRARLDARLLEALAVGARRCDMTVLLGDLTEDADPELTTRLITTAAARVTPLAVVTGNHELRSQRCVESTRVTPVSPSAGVDVATVELTGCDAFPIGSVRRTTHTGLCSLVLSHFPVLSRRDALEATGLPYPGDLANRVELEQAVRELGHPAQPTVVLCGHLHCRDVAVSDRILQVACGSLVEFPYDVTIVTVAPPLLTMERLPVAADARYSTATWRFVNGHWEWMPSLQAPVGL